MSTTLHTIRFSKPVTFTSHAGVSFVNVTTTETASLVTSLTSSLNSTIEYDVTWAVDPVVGDVVTFNYSAGNYVDEDGEAMEDVTTQLTNCLGSAVLAIESYIVVQVETPNGDTIIRSAVLEVTFNQLVNAGSTDGVTATVNGAEQTVVLSGSGSHTLKYTLQRAIFRHDVTWAYDGLGDITAVDGGGGLEVISEQVAVNNLPSFTLFDYNAGATDANTDTTFDTDETRHDED